MNARILIGLALLPLFSGSLAHAQNSGALQFPATDPEGAAVVQWKFAVGGNGRYYQAFSVPSGITWDAAQAFALAHGGYLATIHSAAENAFVFALVYDSRFWTKGYNGTSVGPLLGGIKTFSSQNPSDGWRWVNDDGPFIYTNWAPSEPDNTRGVENRLQFMAADARNRQPTWNDCPEDLPMPGFVVEYYSRPAPPSPPPVVQWTAAQGGNGHFYQAFWEPQGITWEAAQAFAAARGGYLATIGSEAENLFVFNLINDPRFWRNIPGRYSDGPWLGGVKAANSSKPADGWQWIHGSVPLTYTNWAPTQPDNMGGVEDRLNYWAPTPNTRQPGWNDHPRNVPVNGFVIEYDTRPPADDSPPFLSR
jgi:hypothetical protein